MPARRAPTVDAGLLQALLAEWRSINDHLLLGALTPPVMGLSDDRVRLGRWERVGRAIHLSRALVLEKPWGMVRAVLAHEVAHQYVDEVLGVRDETAHGAAFHRTCERMGISPAARGAPAPLEEPRALRRVRKLLALAESPNEHEARLAAARARRLMLEHNLEAQLAATPQRYATRQVGEVRGRFSAHEKILGGLLAQHFFVQCLWMTGFDVRTGRPGRYLELSGTPENLDMAAWVHAFLLETGERLWRDHRRAARLQGDGERRRFLAGVMLGFDEQLRGQAEADRQAGLVWVGDGGLDDFYARSHPRVLTRQGPRVRTTDAFHEGRAAGRDIVLRKPVTAKSVRGRHLIGGAR
ncbi:MAG: DUF2786 domain-containing protein [Pseudomonadota bacterium]